MTSDLCGLCHGAGDLPDPRWRGSTQDPDMPTHPCGACAGRGFVQPCETCGTRRAETTLCGRPHCSADRCLQACRHCMDDLRDERDSA